MKTVEYGTQNQEVVLLLHGGGLSWWNYQAVAEELQKTYHVVIPILDGHGESDRDFLSIEDNAGAIIAHIDQHYQGSVALIGGVSLGGQIALEILSRRQDICRAALIESAQVIPMKLTGLLIKPMLDMSFGLIKHPWFAKLQFRYLRINPLLYDAYYRDTCAITKKNMTVFLKASTCYRLKKTITNTQAKVTLVVGGREQSGMLRSARLLHRQIPGSVLEIQSKLYHGEFSLNHPKACAATVMQLLE